MQIFFLALKSKRINIFVYDKITEMYMYSIVFTNTSRVIVCYLMIFLKKDKNIMKKMSGGGI